MDGNNLKLYHQQRYSSSDYDAYLSDDGDPALYDEIVRYPMRQLYKELSAGHIKGSILLQFFPGPTPHKLLLCCEFFDKIIVLGFNEQNSQELRKWLKNDPGAWDWTHAAKYACELEGKSTGWKEKCEKLRQRVKRVIDCDITADPIVAPGILPLVDCVLCNWGLDTLSRDHDDFRRYLRTMAALLKVGGHVALFSLINAKSFTLGGQMGHCLTYDEEFLRTAFKDAGFVIERLENRPKVDISDYIIYDSCVYVRARRVE